MLTETSRELKSVEVGIPPRLFQKQSRFWADWIKEKDIVGLPLRL